MTTVQSADRLPAGQRGPSRVGFPRSTREPLAEAEDLDLVEVSLVTFPMQPKARVHAVEDLAGVAK